MTIGTLFILILPVFALIAVGVALRRFHRIEGAAETSMIRLVVQVCMPCLVFDAIVGNASLRDPSNLLLPPIAGFATTVAGFGVARLAGQWIGLTRGTGLRSFALAAGICNYSYLPLPIVGGIWGEKAQGMVLVHNMGVDLALWSVGLLVLTGASPLEGWRRIVSPMLVTLVAAVAINVSGLGPLVPGLVRSLAHSLGVCAVPIGLVMTGARSSPVPLPSAIEICTFPFTASNPPARSSANISHPKNPSPSSSAPKNSACRMRI